VDSATDLFRYVNAATALLLATVAALQARRGGRPGRWGAAAFATLAAALLVAELDEGDQLPEWAGRALVCVLLAFPYLLLRFTASFGLVPAGFARLAVAATAAILTASVALPSFPDDGAARPAWYTAYIVAVLVFWTALSLGTMLGLWRMGAGEPTLARRRARLMSAGTGGMNLLIIVAAAGGDEGAGELGVQAVLLLSLVSFAVGFAPPKLVRLAWRQPEQEALRRATEQLVAATTVSEVTDTLLPQVAHVVGGAGVALWDEEGRVVASFGSAASIEQARGSQVDGGSLQTVPLSPPFRALVVATSPLTPFFGREEVGLLHALGALADMCLTRCALSERELESRAALRLAMEEAERANLAKSDFLSRMSHELRTPLNVVLGFGQILEMRDSLDEKDREAVKHILKAGDHLLELINEVLDLARIEAGRMAISPEPLDIGHLVSEALDLIQPLAQDRSVRLTADLGTCRRHVTADRQRLKQVLLNLLSNAVKYNRDGGQVAVSCVYSAEGRLRLHVKDTGPGISPGLMDRLFEPFERLGAESGHLEGTGLGLALCKQLMNLMGGAIGADSRQGQGSTFWVELAIAQPPQQDGAEPRRDQGQHVPQSSEPRRLLLVEDNLANFKVIQALLSEREHIELLPAMTGRLGLELAREHRPDLVLLDQHLPDMTGAEVLHRLKADPETRDLPIVVVSADATPGQIRRMLALGADDYLTKPLSLPRFLEVVGAIVERDGRAS
jgi:signal transduction histidine kinase/CheY-like chemotaxis protein